MKKMTLRLCNLKTLFSCRKWFPDFTIWKSFFILINQRSKVGIFIFTGMQKEIMECKKKSPIWKLLLLAQPH